MKITVPFNVYQLGSSEHGQWYVGEIPVPAFYSPTESGAKKIARQAIVEKIAEYEKQSLNSERWVIQCTDGTVFLIEYRICGWGYAILGPGRTHAGSCLGFNDFLDTLSHARVHASEGYGGIVWEHSLS